MSDRSLRILTSADVDKVLDSLDQKLAVDSQRAVFAAYSTAGDAEDAPGVRKLQLPLRHQLSSPDQTMLFMPARVTGSTSCKIVSVPRAGSDGLPGSTIMMDEKTGKVKAIMNARRLTALRNAAGSVLSYQALATDEQTPAHLVIFGSGTQADGHARAFLQTYPSIKKVTIVARRSTPRSKALVQDIAAHFPSVAVSQGVASYADGTAEEGFDLAATVADADVICTMTSSTQALFPAAPVKKGAHMCLIGSYKPHMREVEDELVKRAGVVLVDSREACGHEAGELQGMSDDQLVELGEVVDASTREKAAAKVNGVGDVNIFKSVGLGVQDVAISAVVLAEAERLGLGTVVEEYD
ncbi:NAD(P)-binding protein [Cutaneotrichosporon oleaginosum]|uniref:NAD(P)-binding protein n=1 Tax=Cutaneotrichosporon oleaginosum TaxID=879819 RepID=A0A0J0XTS9_9TREE|nr:NAD(P)-binding protein [Cutaneotrichosporon oleaginosum]KLT44462.1 NAD(P)-binding protein [Cutaneotrichosporon oleaginosum]TXT07819.1 hypothetical protein COLE_04743 [Cutaneotrichosporon oleaginosum]